MEQLKFERFDPVAHGASVSELTAILHAAYRPLAQQGMRYTASHQPVDVTLRRLSKGEAYLAFFQGRLIGTVTLVGAKPESRSLWYRTPGVYSFHQFAISPELQGKGVGSRMLDLIESRASELGAAELELDTSEGAEHPIALYRKRGYRFIEHVQWNGVNYRSVIMSKALS